MIVSVDWSKKICPDCRERKLVEGQFDSDQIDAGYTVYCEGCGFEIAGRDGRMVENAMLTLMRWAAS